VLGGSHCGVPSPLLLLLESAPALDESPRVSDAPTVDSSVPTSPVPDAMPELSKRLHATVLDAPTHAEHRTKAKRMRTALDVITLSTSPRGGALD
jgi:hypothetical protein